MDGWALLDLLKHDPRTRHVADPRHLGRRRAEARHAGRRLRLPREAGRPRRADGGPSETKEFIDRPVKNLLLVEDDDGQRAIIAALLERRGRADHRRRHGRSGAGGRSRRGASTASSSTSACPTCRGAELIERIRSTQAGDDLPIVVYTGRDLTAEEQQLEQIASTVIVKDARSLREAARRDRAVPAPRHRAKVPGRKQIIVHAQGRRVARGPQGAHRRRRRTQHLLPDQRARAHGHGGGLRARTAARASRLLETPTSTRC